MLRELYAAPVAPSRQRKARLHMPAASLSDKHITARGPTAASQPNIGAPLSAGMQEQIKAVFEILDSDNSGTVEEDELAQAMFALGLTREGSGSDDIKQLLGAVTADFGTSSAIDLAKFSAIMQVTMLCHS